MSGDLEMKIITSIYDVKKIMLDKYSDERGYFMEIYNQKAYKKIIKKGIFVQANQSFSKRGVLRGLHLQKKPHAQAKLVRIVAGKILDIIVDMRTESKTYRQYMAFELDASKDDNALLYVPKGCLHGILALEDNTIVQYMVNRYWNKECEAGVRWDDPLLGIDWQLDKYGLKKEDLIISEKDKLLPFLKAKASADVPVPVQVSVPVDVQVKMQEED